MPVCSSLMQHDSDRNQINLHNIHYVAPQEIQMGTFCILNNCRIRQLPKLETKRLLKERQYVSDEGPWK